jgi:hypothetical protein
MRLRNSNGMNSPATGFVRVWATRVRYRYARCFAALSAYPFGLPPRCDAPGFWVAWPTHWP